MIIKLYYVKLYMEVNSLASSLLLMYFFGTNRSINKLLPQDVNNLFNSNKFIHHIITFFIFIIIISNITYNRISNKQILLYAIIAYLWFLLSLKLSATFLFGLLAVLLTGFITDMFMKDKENNIANTKEDVISYDEKNIILNKFNIIRNLFTSSAIVITFIGLLMSDNKNINNINNINMIGGSNGYSNILEYLFN
jgi:hypothetical protein